MLETELYEKSASVMLARPATGDMSVILLLDIQTSRRLLRPFSAAILLILLYSAHKDVRFLQEARADMSDMLFSLISSVVSPVNLARSAIDVIPFPERSRLLTALTSASVTVPVFFPIAVLTAASSFESLKVILAACVGVGVFVGLGVGVLVFAGLGVGVLVFAGFGVGVLVLVGLGVGVLVFVGFTVGVGVSVGLVVGVGVSVGLVVGVGVSVAGVVGVGVSVAGVVGVGVSVAGIVGVGVSVTGSVGTGVSVTGSVGAGVSVKGSVGAGVSVKGSVGTGVSVTESVGARVASAGVGVGSPDTVVGVGVSCFGVGVLNTPPEVGDAVIGPPSQPDRTETRNIIATSTEIRRIFFIILLLCFPNINVDRHHL